MDKNKKLSLCLALCLAVSIFVAVILIACNSVYSPLDHNEQAGYYVAIDVNPSIELVVDAKGNVLSAGGANKDAQVMLYQEDGIVGVSVNVAVENIAELAVNYGYLKDGQTVSVEVAGEKKGAQALEKQIGTRFLSSVKSVAADMSVTLESAPLLSVSQELAKLKAAHPDDKKIAALDETNYRLVKRVIESDPSATLSEVLDMDYEQMIARIKSLHSGAIGKYGTAYKRLTDSANYTYDCAKQTLDGGLYVTYFANNAIKAGDIKGKLSYAQRTMDAITYLAANSYKLALEYYKSCFDFFRVEPVYELTAEELDQIATAFNVSYAELFARCHATQKNDAYVVERVNLNSFVDFLFRNADQDGKVQIKAAFEQLGEAITSKKDYKTLLQAAETINNVFDTTKNSITQEVLNAFASLVSIFGARFDVDATINACKPVDLDLHNESDLSSAIAQLDKRAKDAFTAMAITDDEIAQINQSTFAKLAKSQLNDAWKLFNSVVENAKLEVQRVFSQEKTTRLFA